MTISSTRSVILKMILSTAIVLIGWFFLSGLPGFFDPATLADGKGPPYPDDSVYACIGKRGPWACEPSAYFKQRVEMLFFTAPLVLSEMIFVVWPVQTALLVAVIALAWWILKKRRRTSMKTKT